MFKNLTVIPNVGYYPQNRKFGDNNQHFNGCAWEQSVMDSDGSCGYNTTIECEDCMYCNDSKGRKNPLAKCNQIKD